MVNANPHPPTLPFLENGDRLERDEFERRYNATPNLKKAELIEGIAYVSPPLRFISHAKPHSNLVGWLWTYRLAVPNVELGIEPTIRLDRNNEPQPDAVLFKVGGQASLDAEGYLVGAPELIAEVSASTVSYDLHDKKRAYERNGVKEYIVWRTFDQQIDWFFLEAGQYQILPANDQGMICSQEFPGLWLDVDALLTGNLKKLLETLKTGLATLGEGS